MCSPANKARKRLKCGSRLRAASVFRVPARPACIWNGVPRSPTPRQGLAMSLRYRAAQAFELFAFMRLGGHACRDGEYTSLLAHTLAAKRPVPTLTLWRFGRRMLKHDWCSPNRSRQIHLTSTSNNWQSSRPQSRCGWIARPNALIAKNRSPATSASHCNFRRFPDRSIGRPKSKSRRTEKNGPQRARKRRFRGSGAKDRVQWTRPEPRQGGAPCLLAVSGDGWAVGEVVVPGKPGSNALMRRLRSGA